MSNLYITADHVGQANHGGGTVTWNESEALKELGPCRVYDRNGLACVGGEPWGWDEHACGLRSFLKGQETIPLMHFYAGTFSKTVADAKSHSIKVTYTAAAHDVAKSRKEHEELGILYNYPHLTDPDLFIRYVKGYLEADVLICPSKHSADVMRGFGAKNRIEVIPHGVDLPRCRTCRGKGEAFGEFEKVNKAYCFVCEGTGVEPVKSLPKQFNVGNLGAWGPDKGLVYLLQAWKRLNFQDAMLLLAGRDSVSPFAQHLVREFGGGNIRLLGWVDDVADFYDQISCYVQSSMSEGFGLEVLEAMAHGRVALCSDGAGAHDITDLGGFTFQAGNVEMLCEFLIKAKNDWNLEKFGKGARMVASKLTWKMIRERYKAVWRGLLL